MQRSIVIFIAWTIFCAFSGLLNSCTFFNVLLYNQPNTDDYKIFSSRKIAPNDVPFRYVTTDAHSVLLDTLRLKHPVTQKELTLKEYLTATKTKAFLVLQNDTLMYRRYFDGYSDSTLHCTFSVSKSITSLIAGCAMDEGRIKGLEQNIGQYIPMLKGKGKFDSLTIEQVFQMKSGLQHTTTSLFWGAFSDEAQFYYTSDMKSFIANNSFVYSPGTRRKYKPQDPTIIAWLVEETARKSVSAYFEEKIWKPIGAEYPARWSLDRENGLEKSSSSFHCTALDLAKIGSLLLHRGNWQGKQIVSARWIQMTTNARDTDTMPVIDNYWKPTQRYFWWIPLPFPRGDFYADGYKGQFLYVNPNTSTVIVKFSDVDDEFHDVPFRRIAEHIALNKR